MPQNPLHKKRHSNLGKKETKSGKIFSFSFSLLQSRVKKKKSLHAAAEVFGCQSELIHFSLKKKKKKKKKNGNKNKKKKKKKKRENEIEKKAFRQKRQWFSETLLISHPEN